MVRQILIEIVLPGDADVVIAYQVFYSLYVFISGI